MTIFHLDDQTAARLAAVAATHGMTVEDYLRSIIERDNLAAPNALSSQEFDEELDELLFDGPSLPTDFSRADIYADHD